MTKEQVREWVKAVSDFMWPENLGVEWTDADDEFYGRFATLVGNAKLEEAAAWCDKRAAAEEHRRDGIDIASRGAEAVIDRLNGSSTSSRRSAEAIRAMKEPTT